MFLAVMFPARPSSCESAGCLRIRQAYVGEYSPFKITSDTTGTESSLHRRLSLNSNMACDRNISFDAGGGVAQALSDVEYAYYFIAIVARGVLLPIYPTIP